MTTQVDRLSAEAMKLSARERADLADRLWFSVNAAAEVEAAWDAEIERRIEQIAKGEVTSVPWDDVMADLRRRFG
jgi:putative addiction module component (TIGR02574 family)